MINNNINSLQIDFSDLAKQITKITEEYEKKYLNKDKEVKTKLFDIDQIQFNAIKNILESITNLKELIDDNKSKEYKILNDLTFLISYQVLNNFILENNNNEK
jgi:6-pyruvoyl-tetrahydropterin synthase